MNSHSQLFAVTGIAMFLLLVPSLVNASNELAENSPVENTEKQSSATEARTTEADTGMSREEAARAAQNPLAATVSVPIQDNLSLGMGSSKRASNVTNIQPVLPIPIKKVLLINRFILPLAYQPDVQVSPTGDAEYADKGGEFGLGDLTYSAFLAPAKQGKVLMGGGPVFSFPTATVDMLKTKRLGIGPALLVVAMPGRVVLGAVVQNIWSVAGPSDGKDINAMLIQYFINVNFSRGFYISSSPIMTANWEAASGQQWIVPVGAGVGKIFKIGKFPINTQVHAYYNVVTPDMGPTWSMRFQVQFFLPSPFGKKK